MNSPTPTNHFLLTDKVALVTGGSRGLGREMIKAFANAGAHVIIASRKFANCQALADEITSTTDRQAMPYGCHVGEWDQIDGMVDAAYERFGRVDILVNNAGMSPHYGSLADHTEALYDKVFDVNLKGPFRLMASVGTRMAKGAGGSIINVSSGGAARPRPSIIPYAAAKAGLNAMTIGFAHAFGPTVRVNCIQAGPFLTDISNAWDLDAVKAEMKRTHAMQRAGEPHEVVGAALYFASDASSWTTGTILPVDGGMPQAILTGRNFLLFWWVDHYSIVAEMDGVVVGHNLGTRAFVGKVPVLGLGPIGVQPDVQRSGIGLALMHAMIGAVDASDEPLIGPFVYATPFNDLP